MKFCPITYEEIPEVENYSLRGLKLLSPQLKFLMPLGYSASEQRFEATARVGKMSIQGVQTKLSAKLKVKEGKFELVNQFGQFILKPQSEFYPELPQNEGISMFLAKSVGIDVPVSGLIYSKDGSMTYFTKRFDRHGHGKKLPLEDFAQLSKKSRDTKYNSSMEQVAEILMEYCTFPRVEALKLFKLTLFNFLIGNEDMHLKNFSLLTINGKIILSPAYDLLNTTIVTDTKEELALPLNGKKTNLRKKDFFEYFAKSRLQLNDQVIQRIFSDISTKAVDWEKWLTRSFLSESYRSKFLAVVRERLAKLL